MHTTNVDADNRKNLSYFKPGQSGNPSGRPKVPQHVRDAARALTTDALKVLEEIMREGQNEGARVRAAETILDRAWGKAAQQVEVTGSEGGPVQIAGMHVDLKSLGSDDFRALRALVLKSAVVKTIEASEADEIE